MEKNREPAYGNLTVEETAYRRGVSQAYAQLGFYIKKHPEMDPKQVVREFGKLAEIFRYDEEPHEFLLEDIYHAVHNEMKKGVD